jgi:sugar lactone lactonase YvrE
MDEHPLPVAAPSGVETLVSGLAFGESPRWHAGRLWFSNWVAQEVVAVDLEGRSETILRVPFESFPFSIDWLPDGRLLVVSTSDRPLLRKEPDGSLVEHADLRRLGARLWNEIVVDGRGRIYVNGGTTDPSPQGVVVLVAPDGSAREVAGGLAFPNGMAVTPDQSTLIVAESFGKKLTAFDIASDGGLARRRVWADLGDGVPDGICLDADGGLWYGDVPNKRCVRVREGGGVLQTIALDRGCFACALGGPDRRTLFMLTAEWRGFDHMTDQPRTGLVQTVRAPARGVGWP